MTSSYRTIARCRLCNSDKLEPLFSLGDQFVSDFVYPGKEKAGVSCPIELVLCRDCTLVQQRHTASQDFLYTRHYWYRSGITDTMRIALADVVRAAYRLVSMKSGDIALDIGSNDGTLLRCYKDLRHEVEQDPGEAARDCDEPGLATPFTVGFEPATNLAEQGRQGVDLFVNDFWSADTYFREVEENHQDEFPHRAKVITALGMLYDLDDPNRFIADVARVLRRDGLFIAQLMCLKQTLELGDVGNYAHEHLEFYSLVSMGRLLHKHGLEIFDVEENTVNGGSYRLFIRHQGYGVGTGKPRLYKSGLMEYAAIEADRGLHSPTTYADCYTRMVSDRSRLVHFLQEEVRSGKKVWIYGASTKGNVLLQWYGLDPGYQPTGREGLWKRGLVVAAADRSPEKWGKVTAGTGIPIVSEDEFRREKPDYALVMPYAFRDEFMRREKDWLSQGGKFIFPLPRLEVVGADGLAVAI